jgi:phage-related minor tail protein
MNDIGLVLTADARAMIKALKDAEGSLKTFSVKTEADLMKMQKAAQETDKVLSGMGQGLSTSQVNKGLADMNRNLAATGQTAKQTAAALRGVPAQITDIVVSLQGGQNPMTVFLQQGGQLKDMFGGVVPAAKALTASLLGMINPVTLAVAAFVALGAAVRAGNQEQQAFRMAIANTGNAAGVTVDQMNGMAEAMGEGFGKTAGKARDALTAMASTGQVARADLQQFAQVAIDVERVTGQSLEKTAENFAALGKDPLGASLRLSGSMNYLTVETYKQIKAAQELGNTQQAAAIAQQAYADAEEARITRAVQGVGYIERAWKAVTGAAVGAWNFMKETWDWLKSIGRDAPVQSQIADIRKELDLYDKGLRNLSGRQVQAYKDQLANLQEVERMSKRAGDAEAERVAANTKGIKALIEEEKNASKVKAEAERKAREAEAAKKEAAREAAKERQKELDVGILRNKLVEENAKAEIKLAKDAQKAHEDSLKPYLQAAKAAEDRVKSLETEEAALQISESMNVSLAQAVEMVNIAKLKEKQIEAMGNEDAVAAIQTEIEAREKLVGLIGDKEARDASSKAAKQAATDWQRASERIEDSITNALLRGFESGKGFAENLRDTLKNMFNTLVLRPIIQMVAGGITGLGGGNASASGGGGAMGTLSSLSQIRSIFTTGSSALAVGGQFMAGTMSSANAAGTIGANMTGTGIDGLLASNGAFGTAGTTATTIGSAATMMGGALVGFMAGKMISGGYSAIGKSGNTAVAAGTAIGAFVGGPIGAAIGGALGGLTNRAFGRKAAQVTGEGITGTFGPQGADVQGYSDWFQKGGWFRSDRSGRTMSALPTEITDLLGQSVGALRMGVAGYANSIGLSAEAVDTFSKSISISLKGLDAAGREKAINDALASFGDDLAGAVLGTAGAAFVRTGETSSQAMVRLSESLHGVNAILGLLDQKALSVSVSAADAASRLADLFGGLQGMTQATNAYYQAFYTEAERNAKTTEQLTTALAGMGAKLPETLSGWRALVEAQDLTTEAGQRNYASLIQLAPAFAQVTGAADSLAAKLGKVASQLTTEALTQIDKQIAASTTAADKARQAADAYRSAGRTLTDAARDIMLGVGDVAQNTAREYQRVLGLARGGDVDAMGRLPGAATAMLADQRNQASTRVQAMLQAAQAAVDLAGVAAAADTAATAADYQAKLFDVNTAMLEVLRTDLSGGNITNDLLRQHLTALGNIGDLITGSQNLTVATYKDQSGQIRAGLVDNSGRVVAGLDSTTALQLQGMSGQTNNFTNSITGQTATFGTLSKEQVLGIKKVEQETSTVADITDIVARATGNNEMLSLAILRQLQVPDAGSNFLSQTITSGNTFLAGRLEGVIAAINKQSEAQQAEIKRQQDLTKAQADLERHVSGQGLALTQAQQTLARNPAATPAQIDALRREIEQVQIWRDHANLFNGDFWETSLNNASADRQIADLEHRIKALQEQSSYNAALQQQVATQSAQYNAELERQRQIIRNLGGIPAFATGGLHSGGLRLVGENGPELEVTGPARYYSAAETSSMMGGGMVDELRGLREEVAMLRAEARATAINTGRTQDIMKRITKNGESMIVSTDGEALEVTAP